MLFGIRIPSAPWKLYVLIFQQLTDGCRSPILVNIGFEYFNDISCAYGILLNDLLYRIPPEAGNNVFGRKFFVSDTSCLYTFTGFTLGSAYTCVERIANIITSF